MKIVLFGCKDTTLQVAQWLNARGVTPALVTLSPEKGKQQDVAGYYDLRNHEDLFSSIYIVERYDLKGAQDAAFFNDNRFDLGIAMGWQRLIPGDILQKFSTGVFGMHGSAQDLPYGRGRSPMNWSIIEGRQWFYTNLFRYNDGVDDGPILDTACFSINDTDTAETLHYKNTLAMIGLLGDNWDNLMSGRIKLSPQKEGPGTLYPKRTPKDGAIDWNDAIVNIDRLIRAVARPFYGAFSFIGKAEILILRASIFYTDLENHPFRQMENGRICDVLPGGKFLVRCNGGVLIVHEHQGPSDVIAAGCQFLPPEAGTVFPRNKYGFFDQ